MQEPYEESVQSETNVAEKLPDAIGKLFSLEYLGALRFEEYLFRYDDYILAVMNAPDSMKHDIFSRIRVMMRANSMPHTFTCPTTIKY